MSWLVSAGEGEIYSVTLIHRAPDRRLASEVPYYLALVNLDEGFRMLARLTTPGSETVKIGSRVRVVFGKGPDGESLPWFELSGSPKG